MTKDAKNSARANEEKEISDKNQKSTPEKKSRVRLAVVKEIVAVRKTQRRKEKIPRQQIEAAIIRDTRLTQKEVDDALVETYDELVALGLVPARA